ncbi:MAG: DUF4230 domain-containing protein [Bacteroidales bacterium]|nr:DUF4230 domain-containing protein [Bacteroidales bacterium]
MTKTKTLLILALLSIFCVSCNEINPHAKTATLENSVYEKMRSNDVAEFGTVEYTITKLVQSKDDAKSVWSSIKNAFGNRKVLLRCKAKMKAGIDLGTGNYRVTIDSKAKSIILSLPHAKVFTPIDMSINDVEIMVQDKGVLRSDFSIEEYIAFLQLGQTQIMADKELKNNIIKQAEAAAEPMFRAMLSQLGFKAVKVEFTTIE